MLGSHERARQAAHRRSGVALRNRAGGVRDDEVLSHVLDPGPPPRTARRTAAATYAAAPQRSLARAALVLFAGKLVHRGVLHDLLAGDLPGLLDDPRKRAVLPRCLLLDLFEHFFWEIETLLPLIGTGHAAPRCWVPRSGCPHLSRSWGSCQEQCVSISAYQLTFLSRRPKAR